MNCGKFESQMELFLAEKLPPASMRECREHVDSCLACRDLLDLAKREPIHIESAQTEELIQAVLDKTSGKSCGYSHKLLPDYIDGAMSTASNELIESHLKNCRSCRQMHQTLKELMEELPALAQIDPGSSFTRECMHAFREVQDQRSQSWIRPGRIWSRLVARPRLAWESAYVLTLLLFVFLKLGTFFPGFSQAEAISNLQTESAQVGVSIVDTIKKNINEWSLSLTDRQDQWAKSSSKSKEEFFLTITFVTDKTKKYSRATSNAVIHFPHSIWNGVVDQVEKIFPKDRTTI